MNPNPPRRLLLLEKLYREVKRRSDFYRYDFHEDLSDAALANRELGFDLRIERALKALNTKGTK